MWHIVIIIIGIIQQEYIFQGPTGMRYQNSNREIRIEKVRAAAFLIINKGVLIPCKQTMTYTFFHNLQNV